MTSESRFISVDGRGVAGLLHPRPVYLITTRRADGSANVASVAWVTPLSHTPPLLGLSVRPASTSATLIAESGEFVVNVVDVSMREAVRLCGSAQASGTDKASAAGLTLVPAECGAVPRLQGVLGWLECAVERRVEAGDHVLFIARVVAAHAREGFGGEWEPGRDRVLECFTHDRFGWLTQHAGGE